MPTHCSCLVLLSPAAPPSEPQYPPAALQQRMSAELNYLEAMEESVRQLGAAERLRAVGLAQQEGMSLAHILKVGSSCPSLSARRPLLLAPL